MHLFVSEIVSKLRNNMFLFLSGLLSLTCHNEIKKVCPLYFQESNWEWPPQSWYTSPHTGGHCSCDHSHNKPLTYYAYARTCLLVIVEESIRHTTDKSLESWQSQCRPTSVLPILSKVIELMGHQQCLSLSVWLPLLKLDTVGVLLNIVEAILSAMDNTKLTAMVLLDFISAFNSIDFDILINWNIPSGQHFSYCFRLFSKVVSVWCFNTEATKTLYS